MKAIRGQTIRTIWVVFFLGFGGTVLAEPAVIAQDDEPWATKLARELVDNRRPIEMTIDGVISIRVPFAASSIRLLAEVNSPDAHSARPIRVEIAGQNGRQRLDVISSPLHGGRQVDFYRHVMPFSWEFNRTAIFPDVDTESISVSALEPGVRLLASDGVLFVEFLTPEAHPWRVLLTNEWARVFPKLRRLAGDGEKTATDEQLVRQVLADALEGKLPQDEALVQGVFALSQLQLRATHPDIFRESIFTLELVPRGGVRILLLTAQTAWPGPCRTYFAVFTEDGAYVVDGMTMTHGLNPRPAPNVSPSRSAVLELLEGRGRAPSTRESP